MAVLRNPLERVKSRRKNSPTRASSKHGSASWRIHSASEKYRDEFDPFAMAWPTGEFDTHNLATNRHGLANGREKRKNIDADHRFDKVMNPHERKEAIYLNHYEHERNVDQKDKYWREWEKTNMADQYDFFHFYGNF